MTGRRDDRGRRHARQDHHHLDDHADPAAGRAGPVLRDRRRDLRGRLERATTAPASYFVAEADESDRSFLLYRPYVSIITNIDARPPQHLRRPGRPGGDVRRVRPADRPGRLRGHLRRRPGHPGAGACSCAPTGGTVYTYGEAADADLRLTDVASVRARACATWPRSTARRSARSALPVPGRHLGLNSAAAVLTACQLGLPLETIVEALAAFPGVRRRFERKGIADGVRVYDEYAYHPTSMTAALRDAARGGRRRPAAGGLPAVPGLPHPGPAGRDSPPRWPSPTRW